jgi:hypothetical protein
MRTFHRPNVGVFAVAAVTLSMSAVLATERSAAAAITEDDLYGQARPSIGLTAALGFRTDLIRSRGLDAFSSSDGISQSALAAAYHIGADELSGVVLGFEWNHGVAESTARGSETSLTIDRLSLGIEGRWPIMRRLCAFGRIAPGLLRDRARVLDGSAPADAYGAVSSGGLQQTHWSPAADISGGLGFRFGELRGRDTPRFGFWLTTEGGYGYARAHDLVLSPQVETQPGRVDEPLRLGTLAVQGAFLRVRLAVSF